MLALLQVAQPLMLQLMHMLLIESRVNIELQPVQTPVYWLQDELLQPLGQEG